MNKRREREYVRWGDLLALNAANNKSAAKQPRYILKTSSCHSTINPSVLLSPNSQDGSETLVLKEVIYRDQIKRRGLKLQPLAVVISDSM